MKKLTIILSFILFASQISVSQGKKTQPKVAAKITFEKTVHDFGKIKKGKVENCLFNYKNDGNDILFISRVVKQCGCTEPKFSQEPLPPGQSNKIEIGFNTESQPLGPFTKTITVFSSAENSTVVLTFKGEIIE